MENYDDELELVCKHCQCTTYVQIKYDHDCINPNCENRVEEINLLEVASDKFRELAEDLDDEAQDMHKKLKKKVN